MYIKWNVCQALQSPASSFAIQTSSSLVFNQ